MHGLLGTEAGDFLATFALPSSAGLRVNSLKIAPQSFRACSPFALQPLPWCAEGFLVVASAAVKPSQHPYYAAGLYYLQDPSAMAAGTLLDPQPGERVLDLCAAPGGKATQLAARLRGRGLLVANELIRGRADILADNLEQWGATRSIVLAETGRSLAAAWPGAFDRVLVDAPCSGEGLFRKNPAARREWTPAATDGCAARQDAILASAADLVRPGGRLVYATCTFAPQENEAVVARLLRRRGDFDLVEPPPLPGFDPGRPDWIAPDLARGLPLERCVRIWPHRAPGEGHFFAVLERAGEEARTLWPGQPDDLPRAAMDVVGAFWESTLIKVRPAQGWLVEGNAVYQAPVHPDVLADLRIVRPGWRVGTLARGRFEPSHALVMGLDGDDVRRCVALEATSPDTAGYLRGEPLASPGPDGWLAVTCDGFPLGWGKRVGDVVKNHYPWHLRWR
jgi:NOL1/NOP2/sun family putative RNA methylase